MGVDQLFRAGYAHLVLGVSPIGGSPNEGGPVQAMTSSDDTQALVRQMK